MGKSAVEILKSRGVRGDLRKAIQYVYDVAKNPDTKVAILKDMKKLTAEELQAKYGKYINVYQANYRKD